MLQVAVLNRFSWNSHGWCESTHGSTLIFLEIIRPIEPLIWGKCAPKNGFLAFIQLVLWGFFEKKISKSYSVPHFPKKRLPSFLSSDTLLPKNWLSQTPSPPPRQKNYFSQLFWKILFFLLNCCMKNIQNLISDKKIYIDFCHHTPTSPQNGHVLPQVFFVVFST